MQKEKQNDKHLIVDTCLSGCLWWEWRWQFVSGSYWADVGLVALLQAGQYVALEIRSATFPWAYVSYAGAQEQDQTQPQTPDSGHLSVLCQTRISQVSFETRSSNQSSWGDSKQQAASPQFANALWIFHSSGNQINTKKTYWKVNESSEPK